jgi:DNA repair protein RadC
MTKTEFLKKLSHPDSPFRIEVKYSAEGIFELPRVRTAEEAHEILKTIWNQDLIGLQEQIVALYLNRAMRLIGYRLISTGSGAGTVLDIRLVVSIALHTMAANVILAHNHPSLNLLPSNQDNSITFKLKSALEMIDSKLSDHIIIGCHNDFLSYADNGLL